MIFLEVHAPILSIWWVKIVVLDIFVAFALASIALTTRIEPGLEQHIVLPRDSYLQVGGNLTVGGIDYFVSDAFGEELYESCKDVKFGTMNSLALQFIGAGAQNFKEWFAFIGRKAAPSCLGSPYAIMFKPNATKSSGMKPINVSTYSRGDISLGCSCGDCPSSSVCSNSASTTTHKRDSCSLKVGTLMVVYDAKKLSSLVAKKKKRQNWLDYYELKYSRNQSIRPTKKTSFLGLCGSRVDAIDFYTAEVERLSRDVSSTF